MFAKTTHARRSVSSLLFSVLLVSLLGVGACASGTAPDDDGDYQPPTDGMRAHAVASQAKQQARINPRAEQAAAFIWFERR